VRGAATGFEIIDEMQKVLAALALDRYRRTVRQGLAATADGDPPTTDPKQAPITREPRAA